MTPREHDLEAIDILRGFVEYIQDVGSVDETLRVAIDKARKWLDDQKAAL